MEEEGRRQEGSEWGIHSWPLGPGWGPATTTDRHWQDDLERAGVLRGHLGEWG